MPLPSTFLLDREPETLWANVSAAWTKSLADFPASAGWQLSYTLTPPSGAAIEALWSTHVTASGDNFAIAIPAALTSAVAAGGAGRLTGKITKATDSAIVYDAALAWLVLGEKSLAQRMLAAIDAMLLSNASREERQLSVTTPTGVSKALELCSKQELLAMRNYWQELVNQERAAEQAALGRGTRRRILNRYTAP
jgi:hypothetical protein